MFKPIHVLLVVLPLVALGGCFSSSDSDPLPTSGPSANGLNGVSDPMKYEPSFQQTDVTGGDVNHMDKKALDHDVDDLMLK